MLKQLLACILFCSPLDAPDQPAKPSRPPISSQTQSSTSTLSKVIADNAQIKDATIQADTKEQALVITHVTLNTNK